MGRRTVGHVHWVCNVECDVVYGVWVLILHDREKRELIVPPALAYGEFGVPGRIPPNSPLWFEVELVDINGVKEREREQQEGSVEDVYDTNDDY